MLWHNFLPHLPRLTRYTLGIKIDNLFIELLEMALTAKFAKREEKMVFLQRLSNRLDNLKFFLTLLLEAKGIDAKQYGPLAHKLGQIGTMLGGWIKKLSPQK